MMDLELLQYLQLFAKREEEKAKSRRKFEKRLVYYVSYFILHAWCYSFSML